MRTGLLEYIAETLASSQMMYFTLCTYTMHYVPFSWSIVANLTLNIYFNYYLEVSFQLEGRWPSLSSAHSSSAPFHCTSKAVTVQCTKWPTFDKPPILEVTLALALSKAMTCWISRAEELAKVGTSDNPKCLSHIHFSIELLWCFNRNAWI